MPAQVVDRVTAAQERLDFGEAGRAMYDFFWSQFADWYIEAAKTRLYGGDAAIARGTRAVRSSFQGVTVPILRHACMHERTLLFMRLSTAVCCCVTLQESWDPSKQARECVSAVPSVVFATSQCR